MLRSLRNHIRSHHKSGTSLTRLGAGIPWTAADPASRRPSAGGEAIPDTNLFVTLDPRPRRSCRMRHTYSDAETHSIKVDRAARPAPVRPPQPGFFTEPMRSADRGAGPLTESRPQAGQLGSAPRGSTCPPMPAPARAPPAAGGLRLSWHGGPSVVREHARDQARRSGANG